MARFCGMKAFLTVFGLAGIAAGLITGFASGPLLAHPPDPDDPPPDG